MKKLDRLIWNKMVNSINNGRSLEISLKEKELITL
jgi:hypothetical protein